MNWVPTEMRACGLDLALTVPRLRFWNTPAIGRIAGGDEVHLQQRQVNQHGH